VLPLPSPIPENFARGSMELTAEQVNSFIANAILESQIGAVVKGAVDRSIADLSKNYQNPFDQVIKNEVASLIQKEVAEKYRPQLEAGIKASIEKHMTDEVIQKIISTAIDKLGRGY
jgi:predicted transcriptional regulator